MDIEWTHQIKYTNRVMTPDPSDHHVVLISGGFGQSSVIFGACQRHETLPMEQETRFTALLLLETGEKSPF